MFSCCWNRLDLLETNIRQRGDAGGSAKKVGLRIKELERLYGIQNGGDRGNQYKEADPKISELANSQTDLASQMTITELVTRKIRMKHVNELKAVWGIYPLVAEIGCGKFAVTVPFYRL